MALHTIERRIDALLRAVRLLDLETTAIELEEQAGGECLPQEILAACRHFLLCHADGMEPAAYRRQFPDRWHAIVTYYRSVDADETEEDDDEEGPPPPRSGRRRQEGVREIRHTNASAPRAAAARVSAGARSAR